MKARRAAGLTGAIALLAIAVVFGLLAGGVRLSPADLVRGVGPSGETARLVACLAVAGAALQALLKNPLADPFLLGTSGGAATGAAIAAVAGLSPLVSPAAAFGGAVLSSVAVAALARRGGRLDLQRLLLAGLIANAFFSAVLLAVFSVASGQTARTMLFWMMGSLADATASKVLALVPYVAAGFAVLLAFAAVVRARRRP